MASRKIDFLYGDGSLSVACPEERLLAVVEPKRMPDGGDEDRVIREAIRNPMGTKRLADIARPGHSVAIVVDDYTRPMTGKKIVPAVLEELGLAGVQDKDVTIIVGLGTHRPCTQEDLERLLGREILQRVEVVNHDMNDRNGLVYIGMTSGANAVWINRLVANADVKVLTGHIGIIGHGFTGGRKSILPAVAGRDTIYYNHRHEWVTKATFGTLVNNPMHDDSMEAAHLARVDFIVNVVLNLRYQVVKAVAGDMVLAWMEGVNFSRELYTYPIPSRPDVVITSASGTPMDRTLFQSLKGVQISYPLINGGGKIILVARCDQGVGDDELEKQISRGPDEVLQRIGRGEQVHFMADILCSALAKAGKIFLKSDLPPAQARRYGFEPVGSVDEALEAALGTSDGKSKILCMPQGPYLAPVLENSGT